VEKAIKVIFVVVIKNEKCFVLSRSTNETIKVKFKRFEDFFVKNDCFPSTTSAQNYHKNEEKMITLETTNQFIAAHSQQMKENDFTENDNTDVVGFQVEGHALQAGAELNHLLGLKLKKNFCCEQSFLLLTYNKRYC
jgi:hypothetical protein